MATKSYTALTPIEHDGQRYEEGAVLALSEEPAAALLAIKAVELKGKKAAAEKPADPDAEAAAAAVAAAAVVDPNAPALL